MKKIVFYYPEGYQLKENDRVLIGGEQMARVTAILIPGSEEASNYSCEEGGFVLVFDNGDVQVWHDTDEDILLIGREGKENRKHPW